VHMDRTGDLVGQDRERSRKGCDPCTRSRGSADGPHENCPLAELILSLWDHLATFRCARKRAVESVLYRSRALWGPPQIIFC
jgi:hypothetical protein